MRRGAIGAGLALALVVAPSANAADIVFRPVVSYPLMQASKPRVADFNQDGRQDIAVEGSPAAQVFLGNGDGTFSPGVTLPTTGVLLVGNFTNDAVPDIITSARVSGNSTLRVYRGNGDGTFTEQTAFAVGSPIGAGSGDFDGDGKTDVYINRSGSARGIEVYGGAGNGTFSARPSQQGTTVLAGDLNGDGRADLLSSFAVLLGQVDGSFVAIEGPPTGPAAATGDFTSDGKVDLVLAGSSETVSVLPGNGDGTFGAALPGVTLGGNYIREIEVADLDNDGKLDLAVVQATAISVLRGNGAGGFSVEDPITGLLSTNDVALGRFDGDGRLDLVAADTEVRIFTQPQDSTPPSTTDDVGDAFRSGPTAVTLTRSDAGVGVSATYYTTGIDPPAPTTGSAVYDPANRPVLAAGEVIRYFSVDRYDNAEAVRTSAPMKIDATVPETVIASGPETLTNNPRPSFSLTTDATEGTFECSLDGGAFEACPAAFRPEFALADGAHTLRARAISRAGRADPSPAEAQFVIDTAPPARPQFTSGRETVREPTARFFFIGDGATTRFTCILDGADRGSCSSPLTLTGLDAGQHVLRVVAHDAAGNASEALVVPFTVVGPRLSSASLTLRFSGAGPVLRLGRIPARVGCGGTSCKATIRAGGKVRGRVRLDDGRPQRILLKTSRGMRRTIRLGEGTITFVLVATADDGTRVTRRFRVRL